MNNESLKKLLRCALVCLVLCCVEPLFAQPKERSRSGVNSASFGVFSDAYDLYLNPLFWKQNSAGTFSVYTGIDDTALSIACAGHIEPELYAAFLFEEKITNYKWWPQNMTDESWTVLVGWQNFVLKGGYYDFCYSGGQGTAQPYLYLGGGWDIGGRLLRVAGGIDVAMQFASGNKMDVYQPQFHVLAAFGDDASKGFGLQYRMMGTFSAAHNVTNVENAPLHHEVFLWYGKLWDVAPQLSAGVRPLFYGRFNAINPTERLHNFLPERGAFDLYAAVPLALEFYPGRQRLFSLVTALKIELYYASFDHLGYDGVGGNNYAGWVPGIGLGLGGRFSFGSSCSLHFGLSYTARPELTADLDPHEYAMEGVSLYALLEAPLTVGVQLRF